MLTTMDGKLKLTMEIRGNSICFLDLKTSIQSTCLEIIHCVKSVRIQSYSGPYFPAFGLNYGPEQLLKRTIFTQWCVASDYVMRWNSYNNLILRILRILFQWDKIHGFTISVPGLKLPIFWQLLLRNEILKWENIVANSRWQQ